MKQLRCKNCNSENCITGTLTHTVEENGEATSEVVGRCIDCTVISPLADEQFTILSQ